MSDFVVRKILSEDDISLCVRDNLDDLVSAFYQLLSYMPAETRALIRAICCSSIKWYAGEDGVKLTFYSGDEIIGSILRKVKLTSDD